MKQLHAQEHGKRDEDAKSVQREGTNAERRLLKVGNHGGHFGTGVGLGRDDLWRAVRVTSLFANLASGRK